MALSPFTEAFCIRADVLVHDESGLVGIAVMKINVNVEVTFFAKEGNCTADIQTFTFTGVGLAAVDAVREDNMDAYLCDEDGHDTAPGSIEIGSVLNSCVFSSDTDVNVAVSSLSLKYGNTVLVTPITDSTPNFVTEVKEVLVGGKSNQVQVISSLMTPIIFDSAGGHTIMVSGVADITYTRHTQEISSYPQSQWAASFNLEFKIGENKELSLVVKGSVESSGESAVFGFLDVMRIMAIGAAFCQML